MSYYPESDSHIRDKVKVVFIRLVKIYNQERIRPCYRH